MDRALWLPQTIRYEKRDAMLRYIMKRIAMCVIVAVAVSFLVYWLEDLRPEDPVLNYISVNYTQEEYDEMYVKMGLDKPLIARYGLYMWDMLHGELGMSYKYNTSVWELFMSRLPNTLLLSLTATFIALILAVPLGVYAALHRGKLADNLASAFAVFGLSAPSFWVGLMLIIVFSLKLGWFNSGQFNEWGDLVLPAATIAIGHMAALTRQTRSAMVDVGYADFLMLARAKGVSEKNVILHHELRNSMIPIATVFFAQLSASFQGSILVETVFSWPGIGRLIVEAVKSNDIQLATGCIVMSAIMSTVLLLFCDIAYMFIDPRSKTKFLS